VFLQETSNILITEMLVVAGVLCGTFGI